MSKSRVLVFVVTFMSFIDYSYLNRIVVLPNITDRNFGEYLSNIDWKGTGKILRDNEFYRVKDHYENVMKAEYQKPENEKLVKVISNFAIQNEKRLLRTLMNFKDCEITIRHRLNDYIETRKKHYDQKILKRDEMAERNRIEAEEATKSETEAEEPEKIKSKVETMHDDNELLTLEDQFDEELKFLQSLDELIDNKGRIRNLYLTTAYGSNQHIIHAQKNSIDSVWLYLLRSPDPMFGEKYSSYAFRVISMNKMPLPNDGIPEHYGNGKLHLFDEFDIWPELNGVYIMYYLFNCPLQQNVIFDASHSVTDV